MVQIRTKVDIGTVVRTNIMIGTVTITSIIQAKTIRTKTSLNKAWTDLAVVV